MTKRTVVIVGLGCLSFAVSHHWSRTRARTTAPAASAMTQEAPQRRQASTRASPHDSRALATGMDVDRSDAAVREETVPRHVPIVDLRSLDLHIEHSAPDPRAVRGIEMELAELERERGVEVTRRIDCSTSVCRAGLEFGTREDFFRFGGARPRRAGEFSYQVTTRGPGSTSVRVYTTAAGVTFDDVVRGVNVLEARSMDQ